MAKGRLSVKDEAGVLEAISDYWVQITMAVSLVFGWANLHFRTEQNRKDNEETRRIAKRDIDELEARQEARRHEDVERVEKTMNTIQKDIKTLLGRH